MKLEISGQVFEKLKYQTVSKSVQWEPSCSMRNGRRTDRQIDRHDEVNSHISSP
jgi:hypothetical protein